MCISNTIEKIQFLHMVSTQCRLVTPLITQWDWLCFCNSEWNWNVNFLKGYNNGLQLIKIKDSIVNSNYLC